MASRPPVQVGTSAHSDCSRAQPSSRPPALRLRARPDLRDARHEEVRLPTKRKIDQVASLTALLSTAEIAIAADYQGMTVAAQTELRQTLRKEGVQMRVVKNTLLRRAATDSGRPQMAALAMGATALVVSDSDPIAAARLVAQYRSEHANTPFVVRSAVMGEDVVNAAYVADLATVPPRDVLLAKIAGSLTSKVAELAGLLQATTRDFAGLIDARATQLEGQG